MGLFLGAVVAISLIGIWFFGNAAWILALVNFIWLLVKGTILFSWWYPIGSGIIFVVLLVVWMTLALWAQSDKS